MIDTKYKHTELNGKTPDPNKQPHEALAKLSAVVDGYKSTISLAPEIVREAIEGAAKIIGLEDHRDYTEAESFVAEIMMDHGFAHLNDNADFYVCRLQDVLRLMDSIGLTANVIYQKSRIDKDPSLPALEPSARDGYVAVLPDGQYAIVSGGHGFTGTKMHVCGGPLTRASVLPKAEWDKVFKHINHQCPLIVATKHTTVSVQLHAKGFPPRPEAPGDE